MIGDWQATVQQFYQFAPLVKRYNFPIGFVSQDGLAAPAAPWDEFDVLFIGGSDKHKFTESWELIDEAKRRGKWVHIGRVNSAERILLFRKADSWDGTTLAKEPSISNQLKLLRAARLASAFNNGQQRGLF